MDNAGDAFGIWCVQLPNDNTMIGDTTLCKTQFPTVIAKHVKVQFPYVYAT
jgi:hypothetical protein